MFIYLIIIVNCICVFLNNICQVDHNHELRSFLPLSYLPSVHKDTSLFSMMVSVTLSWVHLVRENVVSAWTRTASDPTMSPGGDSDALVAKQEGHSLCFSSPNLTAIFHCSVTFTRSLPGRQVSSSSWFSLPRLLSTTDPPRLPTTLTLISPSQHLIICLL